MKALFKRTLRDSIQHSSVFYGNFFINVGERSQTNGDDIPIKVYYTETSEQSTFIDFKRFRHSSFLFDNLLYIHGELENQKHNNLISSLSEINLLNITK